MFINNGGALQIMSITHSFHTKGLKVKVYLAFSRFQYQNFLKTRQKLFEFLCFDVESFMYT